MDVPRSTCKRSAWRVIRISWISRLYLKVLSNEWGSLLLAKSYMNNEDWYSYKSFKLQNIGLLKQKFSMTIIFCFIYCTNCTFCSNSVLCTTDWQALPHAKIPYMRSGWMSATYSVLRLSTGEICLTYLIEIFCCWCVLNDISVSCVYLIRYPKLCRFSC